MAGTQLTFVLHQYIPLDLIVSTSGVTINIVTERLQDYRIAFCIEPLLCARARNSNSKLHFSGFLRVKITCQSAFDVGPNLFLSYAHPLLFTPSDPSCRPQMKQMSRRQAMLKSQRVSFVNTWCERTWLIRFRRHPQELRSTCLTRTANIAHDRRCSYNKA